MGSDLGFAHGWLKRVYFEPEIIHAIPISKRSFAMGRGHIKKGEGA